jgi:hypothetical protein
VKVNNGHDTLTGGSGENVIRAGDSMRDLIVCGDNRRNLIYYDPGLDRFDNCVFENSESSKERSSGARSAS